MKKIWPHLIIVPLLLLIPVVTFPDFDGSLDIFKHNNFLRDLLRFVLAILFFSISCYPGSSPKRDTGSMAAVPFFATGLLYCFLLF